MTNQQDKEQTQSSPSARKHFKKSTKQIYSNAPDAAFFNSVRFLWKSGLFYIYAT